MATTSKMAHPVEPSHQPVGASQSPGEDAPACPIDTDALLSRCMGNHAFAEVLLSELAATGAQRVDEIRRFAASAAYEATADAAHALRGAVAIIGAEPLRELAAEIEAVSKAGVEAQLAELVEQLADEMRRCLDFIRDLKLVLHSDTDTLGSRR